MPKRCSFRKLFKAIDKDRNGTVTLTEVKNAFKKASGSNKQLSYTELNTFCSRSTRRGTGSNINPCRSDVECMEDEECKQKNASGLLPVFGKLMDALQTAIVWIMVVSVININAYRPVLPLSTIKTHF